MSRCRRSSRCGTPSILLRPPFGTRTPRTTPDGLQAQMLRGRSRWLHSLSPSTSSGVNTALARSCESDLRGTVPGSSRTGDRSGLTSHRRLDHSLNVDETDHKQNAQR